MCVKNNYDHVSLSLLTGHSLFFCCLHSPWLSRMVRRRNQHLSFPVLCISALHGILGRREGVNNISLIFFYESHAGESPFVHFLRMTMRCTYMRVQTFSKLIAKKKYVIFPDCSQFWFCFRAGLLLHILLVRRVNVCLWRCRNVWIRWNASTRVNRWWIICSELNVGKSTVNDWRRDRPSIKDFCAQMKSNKNLKTRSAKNKDEIRDSWWWNLWLWFLQ